MRRLRKPLLYGLYLVVAVSVSLVTMELALAAAYKITGYHRLDTLHGLGEKAVLPDNPEEYVKIAIYGGSSAHGFGAGIDFGRILAKELEKRYPALNFFVQNHSVPGYPFHRHQAELLKSHMDKYDIFLIYAGHNETQNYFDDTGYFRPPEEKGNKQLNTLEGLGSGPAAWIRSNSRLLAITQKINRKYVRPILGNDPAPNVFKQHAEFEARKAMPPDELAKVAVDYGKDLREIALLAEAKGKTVIVSSAASNETYPPYFSVHDSGLPEEALAAFDEYYQKGLSYYGDGQYDLAVSNFEAAAQIDGGVAILSYYLGQSYLNLGKAAQGRLFVQKSFDDDGLPTRVFSSTNLIAQETADEYDNLYFVDSVRNFFRARDAGLEPDDLFIDTLHPSLVGQAIIAHTFLSQIAQAPPMNSQAPASPLLDFESPRLGSLLESQEREYPVPEWLKRRLLLGNSENIYHLAKLTPYPDFYLGKAEQGIRRWYELSNQTPADEAMLLLFEAMLEGKRGDLAESMKLANRAARLAPERVNDLLYEAKVLEAVQIGNWISQFNEYGMDYSADENEFVLLDAALETVG